MKKLALLFLFILAGWATIIAQETYNGRIYRPMPLPALDSIVKPKKKRAPTLVAFDVETSRETTSEPEALPKDLSLEMEEGQRGISIDLPAAGPLEKSFGDLEEVQDYQEYPWRTNVKVFMEFSKGNYVCSGVLIDSRHVLTAGHCLYDYENQEWAKRVSVAPAYRRGDRAFGEAESERLYSWTSWTKEEDYDWDMGYIRLDRPVGALTGWLGYGYRNEDQFYRSTTFYNPSYPAADPYDGQIMYSHRGSYTQVYDDRLYFDKTFYGGASGSGSFHQKNDRNYVTAVHSHSQPGLNRAGQTRMTSGKFNAIRNKILENTPDEPDLIPLMARSRVRVAQAGADLEDLSFYVHNYAQASFEGALRTEVYLSHNETVSSQDRSIARLTFRNVAISAKGTKYFRVPRGDIHIPEDIEGGTYYLGIRITTDDADDQNNFTSDWDAAVVEILPARKLTVSQSLIEAFNNSTTTGFSIRSNVQWQIRASEPWVKIGRETGAGDADEIQVAIQANLFHMERRAVIIVEGEGLRREIEVVQPGRAWAEAEPFPHLVYYPNPARERLFLHLELPQAETVRLELLAVDGRPVRLIEHRAFDSGIHDLDLNLSGLSPGLYFCRMIARGESRTYRILVH